MTYMNLENYLADRRNILLNLKEKINDAKEEFGEEKINDYLEDFKFNAYSNEDLRCLNFHLENFFHPTLQGLIEEDSEAPQNNCWKKASKSLKVIGALSLGYLLLSSNAGLNYTLKASADKYNNTISGNVIDVSAAYDCRNDVCLRDVTLSIDTDNDGASDQSFIVENVNEGLDNLTALKGSNVIIFVDADGNPAFGTKDGNSLIFYDHKSELDGFYDGIIKITDDDIAATSKACRNAIGWEYDCKERSVRPNNDVERIAYDNKKDEYIPAKINWSRFWNNAGITAGAIILGGGSSAYFAPKLIFNYRVAKFNSLPSDKREVLGITSEDNFIMEHGNNEQKKIILEKYR